MGFDGDAIQVPGPEDPWFPTVNEFALTFNGYLRLGNFEAVAKVSDECSSQFRRDGTLPDELDPVRTALFMEQRGWRDQMASPYDVPEAKAYIQALVEKIRELSGGTLSGPGDPYP
jgi:hypothetical protein